jgi:holliday junction DNA helicase RuvA
MITKLTGVLTRVLDDEARLAVGAIEYQLLVSEAVRRQIQMRIGQEVTFHVAEYLEGNSGGSRFVPRKIGFNSEAELEFFDLFCTVEKIGVKKALKAMARPVKEIADAISRQDARWLSTLPGIGATTAEQIVTTLKRKVMKFAAMNGEASGEPGASATGGKDKASRERQRPEEASGEVAPNSQLIEDIYQALMSLGHNPLEARNRLDSLLTSGKSFRNVQDAITLIYSHRV